MDTNTQTNAQKNTTTTLYFFYFIYYLSSHGYRTHRNRNTLRFKGHALYILLSCHPDTDLNNLKLLLVLKGLVCVCTTDKTKHERWRVMPLPDWICVELSLRLLLLGLKCFWWSDACIAHSAAWTIQYNMYTHTHTSKHITFTSFSCFLHWARVFSVYDVMQDSMHPRLLLLYCGLKNYFHVYSSTSSCTLC